MGRRALAITGVLVVLGIALRVRLYVQRGDFWLDEVWLAANLVHRSWRALIFTPLDSAQVAPPGFLLAAKTSMTLFGMSEHALRLPALLSSIAALILVAVVSSKTMKQWETSVAMLLMAISPLAILQASEFKQYSTDLLVAVVLTYIVIRWRATRYSKRWSIIAATTALWIVFLSDTAALMLGGLGIALVVLAILERDRIAARAAMIVAPAWLIAVAGLVWSTKTRVSPRTSQVMHHYWDTAFFPIPPRSLHDVLWLPWSLRLVYRDGFGLRELIAVPLIMMVLGLYSMWRSGRRDVVLFLCGPVVVTLLAGAARLYPFRDRLVLFLLPAFALSFAAGVIFLVSRLNKWAPLAALALTLALLHPLVFALQIKGMHRYVRNEQITPVLAHVAAQRRADDKIYVVWSAAPAMSFYAPRFGFKRSDWFASRWRRDDDWDLVWKDLEQFRGANRLWIVTSFDEPPSVRDRILAHLDSVATPVPSGDYPGRNRPRTKGSAFLYEMRPGRNQ